MPFPTMSTGQMAFFLSVPPFALLLPPVLSVLAVIFGAGEPVSDIASLVILCGSKQFKPVERTIATDDTNVIDETKNVQAKNNGNNNTNANDKTKKETEEDDDDDLHENWNFVHQSSSSPSSSSKKKKDNVANLTDDADSNGFVDDCNRCIPMHLVQIWTLGGIATNVDALHGADCLVGSFQSNVHRLATKLNAVYHVHTYPIHVQQHCAVDIEWCKDP